ncbi:MAG: hypothetical protein U0930_11410 [Pirellulales bacterium]
MPKKIPGDEQIIQLVDEFTWMGGDPGGIYSLLNEYEFERSTIQSAIDAVMSRHSCTTTYASALRCKDILESALARMSD